MAQLTSPWSSPFESWHSRALLNPFPSPYSFTPSQDRLILTMILNAQTEPEGLSLALFSLPDSTETIAVDARGRVLLVSEKDSQGLLALAQTALALPKTGRFWNGWSVKQNVSCFPVHRLFVSTSASETPGSDGEAFHQISVAGYSKEKRVLSDPVGKYTELPDALWELFGLVLEARADAGSRWDNQRDEMVLGKVREALEGVITI
ncbi:hypothetical protein DXG01_016026 [Tephrocybe rancida]|nr:hypothetical protein DXG01_016026 [Tephrocybe rancida]